ncbi:uncharacterized protein Nmlp_3165 [Natronomonas moolapensis 8.8.11]|uniref:Uncharacterized protein n=1 Tax=Natronomonas moolapensis (strain DSM 18674 / CECT 7526 / JCM 14361 / 8.8.11) TaxID=268739 RepID=M1XSF5_NATM8|nr:uncharacterized protein Nmlp_3165 [Natronomonas moolapensis 8.8.11]
MIPPAVRAHPERSVRASGAAIGDTATRNVYKRPRYNTRCDDGHDGRNGSPRGRRQLRVRYCRGSIAPTPHFSRPRFVSDPDHPTAGTMHTRDTNRRYRATNDDAERTEGRR